MVHKRAFVTFAMMSAVAHRPEIGEAINPSKERKEPRKLGCPAMVQLYNCMVIVM